MTSRWLFPLCSLLLLLSMSCKKTAELSQADAGGGAPVADAAEPGAAADAGPTSTKGRPRNLSVEHGTAALRTKLSACYATALTTHPDEKGGTELSLFIAADGHVKEAKVTGSTLSNDTLDCLRHTSESFAFDPLDRDTGIMIPLFFSPKPDGGPGSADAADGGVRRRLRDAGAR